MKNAHTSRNDYCIINGDFIYYFFWGGGGGGGGG